MSRDYFDVDGNRLTLDELCRRDPGWAANRIRAMVPAPDAATVTVRFGALSVAIPGPIVGDRIAIPCAVRGACLLRFVRTGVDTFDIEEVVNTPEEYDGRGATG